MDEDVDEPTSDWPRGLPDEDYPVLGPECFTNREATVISFQGENFYRACGYAVHIFEPDNPGGAHSSCVKRKNHPGIDHEDYDGRTVNEIYGENPVSITIPIPHVSTQQAVTRTDVRVAWNAFVKPTQDAREEMSPETRTVAAILRAVNAALPMDEATVEVNKEKSE